MSDLLPARPSYSVPAPVRGPASPPWSSSRRASKAISPAIHFHPKVELPQAWLSSIPHSPRRVSELAGFATPHLDVLPATTPQSADDHGGGRHSGLPLANCHLKPNGASALAPTSSHLLPAARSPRRPSSPATAALVRATKYATTSARGHDRRRRPLPTTPRTPPRATTTRPHQSRRHGTAAGNTAELLSLPSSTSQEQAWRARPGPPGLDGSRPPPLHLGWPPSPLSPVHCPFLLASRGRHELTRRRTSNSATSQLTHRPGAEMACAAWPSGPRRLTPASPAPWPATISQLRRTNATSSPHHRLITNSPGEEPPTPWTKPCSSQSSTPPSTINHATAAKKQAASATTDTILSPAPQHPRHQETENRPMAATPTRVLVQGFSHFSRPPPPRPHARTHRRREIKEADDRIARKGLAKCRQDHI